MFSSGQAGMCRHGQMKSFQTLVRLRLLHPFARRTLIAAVECVSSTSVVASTAPLVFAHKTRKSNALQDTTVCIPDIKISKLKLCTIKGYIIILQLPYHNIFLPATDCDTSHNEKMRDSKCESRIANLSTGRCRPVKRTSDERTTTINAESSPSVGVNS